MTEDKKVHVWLLLSPTLKSQEDKDFGVTCIQSKDNGICPIHIVLYILIVVWLLSCECSDFIHIRHSLQSWDPLGWNTHQLTWSLSWPYFPQEKNEAAQT